MIKNFSGLTNIEKTNFKDKINVEYYTQENGDKHKGISIIKHNDMLQYHYFSQSYNILKHSSIVALFTITNKNIKYYIGFACFSSAMLNKFLRNKVYGLNFLKIVNKFSDNLKFYTISRTVLLPSYRGLGLSKHFQTLMLNHIMQDKKVFSIELYSGMFHSFDFASNTFNKTLLTLKKSNEYEQYFILNDYEEMTGKAFNRKTKYFANGVHYINEKNLDVLQTFYRYVYNIDINIDKFKTINDTVNMNNLNLNDLNKYEIPIFLTSIFTMDELKNMKRKKLQEIYVEILKNKIDDW